jgi:hypothetical protein
MRSLPAGIALAALVTAPALACGPQAKGAALIPPVAAALDKLLPKADLPEADLEKVKALRVQIKDAMTAGNEKAARAAEEQAMKILGYTKSWLRCGPGTFSWMKTS